MNLVHKAEKTLEDLFRGAPKLPLNVKKSLADVWPWFALVGGIVQIMAAYGLWQVVQIVSHGLYGVYAAVGPMDYMFAYIGLAVLLAEGVILLAAFSPLRAKTKKGWDLVFLAALINLGYAVIALFIAQRGMGDFMGGLIGSAIGFYLLFQIKEFFVQPHAKAKK